MNHIAAWATKNNLLLNKSKTKEIIFTKNKRVVIPSVVEGRERVESLKNLGVTLQSNLTMKDHVTDVISTCTNMVYALNMLRSHGLNQVALQQIFILHFKNFIQNHVCLAGLGWSCRAVGTNTD